MLVAAFGLGVKKMRALPRWVTLEKSFILSANGKCAAQLAGLRIQRDSVCEAPRHKAWPGT